MWGPEAALSPAAGSRLLAIAGSDSIRLFDTGRLRTIRTIADENYHASHVLFSPDGTTVIMERTLREANDHEFGLWRVSDGTQLRGCEEIDCRTGRLEDVSRQGAR